MKKKFLEIIGICLFFLILSLIDTYPLINYLNKGMPYSPYPEKGHEISYMVHGDYLQLYYNFWLFKDALFGETPFLRNPYEFSVGKDISPTFTTQALPLSFFYAVLSPFGEVTAYNLLIIGSYIITGISGYLLIKLYTKSTAAGILAGIIFALFPYRTGAVLGGHGTGFVFFLLPLTIYFVELSFRKKSWIYSIWAGVTVTSMAFLEYHLFYYTLLFFCFFIPWRLFSPFYEKDVNIYPPSIPPLVRGEKGGLKEILIVFSSGVAVALSLILVRSKSPILSDSLFYTSVIFPFLLFVFWIIYSSVFSLLTGLPFRQSLKEDALSYLPLVSFLIYLTRFIYPIEHLGKLIALISIGGIVAMKGYRLFRHRIFLYERLRGMMPELRPLFIKTILPLSIIILLTIGWSFYLRTFFEESIAGEGRPLHQIMRYSPQVNDFLERHNKDIGKNIYLGIVPLLLAGIGLFLKKERSKRKRLFFGGVFFVSLILSFGTNLEPYIPFYTILYNHLPFFNYPRVAGRMISIAVIAMAVLAGYGLKWLIASPPSPQSSPLRGEGWVRGRHFCAGLVFIVIILDFIPFSHRGVSIVRRENPVYEEIKRNLGDKKVLEIPLWPGDSAWSSIYEYYVTIYKYPMINGYSPAVTKKYVDQIFEPLSTLNFGEISEKEYDFLRKLQVRYIVMHGEEFPRKVSPFPFRSSLDNMKRSPFVKYIMNEGLIHLFELNEEIGSVKPHSFSIKSPVGGLYQAEVLPRLTGSIVKDPEASGGQAAFGKRGEGEGWLCYGPYRTYPTGEYKAIFRLKIGEKVADGEVAVIDIATKVAKGVLNKKVITTVDFRENGYQDFVLPFTLSSPQVVEFRVYYKNIVDMWVDYTYILTLDEKDPRWSYRSEGLFKLPDRFEGPTRRYPAGDYVATFYLKTDDNTTMDDIASIRVLAEDRIISEKGLKKGDFPRAGEYYIFPLEFKLGREAFLDFMVSSKDLTKVGLERIEIVKGKD